MKVWMAEILRKRTRRFMFPSLSAICICWTIVFGLQPANAQNYSESVRNILTGTKISGHLRLYNFSRLNDEGTPVDNNALAAGGDATLTTGSFKGFSAAAAFYSANNIHIPGETVNEVLVGEDHYLEAIPVAYLQYEGYHMLARGGRQLINTPFARGDMFTMLPRAFNGLAATIAPLGWFGESTGPVHEEFFSPVADEYLITGASHLYPPPGPAKPDFSMFVARMFAYESRFDDHFIFGNRYTNQHTDGFITTGLRYNQKFAGNSVTAQGWFYDFFDFAMLGYLEGTYRWDGNFPVSPLFGFQFITEGNSGDQRLGSVDVQIYGLKAGIAFPHGVVSLVGNWSPTHYDNFRHGGLIHPYNDLSGTFYTDTMNNGMGDIGPGYAYGIKCNFDFLDKKLDVYTSYIRYVARYGYGGAAYSTDGSYGFPQGEAVKNQKQWEFDLGVGYSFKGVLKGLKIYDHLGIRDAYDWPVGAFVDNRLATIYAFSF